MKKTYHSENGIEEKEITQEEVEKLASEGDLDCKKELYRQQKASRTVEQRLDALEEILGL